MNDPRDQAGATEHTDRVITEHTDRTERPITGADAQAERFSAQASHEDAETVVEPTGAEPAHVHDDSSVDEKINARGAEQGERERDLHADAGSSAAPLERTAQITARVSTAPATADPVPSAPVTSSQGAPTTRAETPETDLAAQQAHDRMRAETVHVDTSHPDDAALRAHDQNLEQNERNTLDAQQEEQRRASVAAAAPQAISDGPSATISPRPYETLRVDDAELMNNVAREPHTIDLARGGVVQELPPHQGDAPALVRADRRDDERPLSAHPAADPLPKSASHLVDRLAPAANTPESTEREPERAAIDDEGYAITDAGERVFVGEPEPTPRGITSVEPPPRDWIPAAPGVTSLLPSAPVVHRPVRRTDAGGH